MRKIRAFFALPLQEGAVRRLTDYADSLCVLDRNAEAFWVDADHYHLTLCFLGNLTLEQITELEAVSRTCLQEERSFQVEIGAADYYPVSSRMAVIAAMAATQPALLRLRHLLVGAAQQIGLGYQELEFRPHITLARLPPNNEFQPPASWPRLEQLSLADSVVLYQSKPGSQGSIYTPLFEVPLLDID